MTVASIDLAGLLDLIAGDEDLLAVLINLFVEDAPIQLSNMQLALAAGDAGDLARGAHRINGAARSMCLPQLTALTAELERVGLAGDLGAAAPLVSSIAAEVEAVRIAFESPHTS